MAEQANRKKILVDCLILYVAQTGVRTYLEELCNRAENFQNKKHEYLIVPNFATASSSNFFRGRTSKVRNILFQTIYFFWKQVALPYLAWKHKADIIFCTDFIVPAVKTRATKIPVIHDTFFWESPQNYNKWWLKYYLISVKLGLRGRSVIVTTSQYSAQRIKQYLGNRSPSTVVYQGSRFGNNAGSSPIDKWPIHPKRYFLHVGVFEKRKNLGTLVNAFYEFQKITGVTDVKLVLVGQRGPREALDDYDEVVTQIHKLNLKDSIVLTGYVTAGELQSLYSNALVYVFPSKDEGFGLPILEAFSNEIPVIVSESGALKEIGGNAVVTFKTTNFSDLASKMREVYESKELRDELTKKGNERLETFSWDKFFSSLEKLFDSDNQSS